MSEDLPLIVVIVFLLLVFVGAISGMAIDAWKEVHLAECVHPE